MVKPFSRPSVNLGGAKKEWREVEARTLLVGDLVMSLGLITSVVAEDPANFDDIVQVLFLSGERKVYHGTEKVNAFVQAD